MKPHLRIQGIEHTRCPLCLSRRTALLVVACALGAGCTLSTWLHLLLTSS